MQRKLHGLQDSNMQHATLPQMQWRVKQNMCRMSNPEAPTEVLCAICFFVRAKLPQAVLPLAPHATLADRHCTPFYTQSFRRDSSWLSSLQHDPHRTHKLLTLTLTWLFWRKVFAHQDAVRGRTTLHRHPAGPCRYRSKHTVWFVHGV
jgi:hypothetical protein